MLQARAAEPLGRQHLDGDRHDKTCRLRHVRERLGRYRPHRFHRPRPNRTNDLAQAAPWPCAASARWSMLFDSFPAPVTAEARARLLHVSDLSYTRPRQTTAE